MEIAKDAFASDTDLAQVEEMRAIKARIAAEIRKVIVGQDKVIEEILIALFCRGHSPFGGRARPRQDASDFDTWRGSWSCSSTGSSSHPT